MKYFTIKELTKSATAEKHDLKNEPSDTVKANLIGLIALVLDPWGSPIKLT